MAANSYSSNWTSLVNEAACDEAACATPLPRQPDAVEKARAERREKQAIQLLDHIEGELGQYEMVDGTFLTARVVFPDKDTVYRYAWIRSGNRWYRTHNTRAYRLADVVDELVQLTLDADEVEWEIVGWEES